MAAGFAFVYFTEKLLGFRKLTPQQEEKLVTLAQQHETVSEYWRQVAEQGRYIVVNEYDAIEAYVRSWKRTSQNKCTESLNSSL